MKRKILVSFFVYLLVFTPYVYAANIRIQGKVVDGANNPIGMGSIVLVDGAGKTITAATTDGSGRYDITAPNGIYTITISGPQGSNITPTTLKDQVLSNDSQRDFALSTPQPAKAIKSTIPYAAIAPTAARTGAIAAPTTPIVKGNSISVVPFLSFIVILRISPS